MDVVMRQYGRRRRVDVGRHTWDWSGIAGRNHLRGVHFGCGARLAKKGSLFACLLAPFLWVAVEFCALNLPIFAFPWNLIGYAASGNLALVQLTTITGIYGLSFVVAAFGSLLAYVVFPGASALAGRARCRCAIEIALGGYWFPQAAAHHVAHLVQTNFPQSEEYPPDWNRIHAGEMNSSRNQRGRGKDVSRA